MEVIIREATKDDLPSMYLISVETHRRAYGGLIPPEGVEKFTRRYTASDQAKARFVGKMTDRLAKPQWQLWVAELEGCVVGYTLREWKSEDLLQLRGLFIHPDYFKQGIGRKLFEESLQSTTEGTKVVFTVLRDNERAKKLYVQYGFKVIGTDKDFYGAPQDVMQKVVD